MHRHLLPLVLLAALFPFPGGPARAAEKDLVVDGGFEKGSGEGEVRNLSGALKVERDTKERKSGRASLRLVKSGGPGGFRADGLAFPLPDLPAGAKVRVSAAVRGREAGNSWLKFMAYDEDDNQLLDQVAVNDANFAGTFDWRSVEKEFEVPEDAVRGELVLYLYLDGELWLDDLSVLPLGKGKPRTVAKAEPLDAATRRWLAEHAVPVKHLRLRGGMEDLAPLKTILKDVRVVQLGENTHRDGACFEAKVRLIRFLHEEMGFDVLAFESGMYECDRANGLLRAGKGGEALGASVFGIWRNSIVANLFDWMAVSARGDRPLTLAGFDCRASGSLAGRFLDEIAKVLELDNAGAEAAIVPMRRLEALMDEMGDDYRPPEKELAAGLAGWKLLAERLEDRRAALVKALGEEETAFLARCLDNWKAREAFERSKTVKDAHRHHSTNLRDGAMAENLLWLAEKRYPGRKIITWGATFHLAHGLDGVSMDGDGKYYDGCRNMGQGVHEALGDAVYTVGFAAHGGKGGAFGQEFAIPKPRRGSVEDTLHRYGEPLLFVDLRPEKGPFRRVLKMGPLGYSRNCEANWPAVLDGVFYIEEMTPAK